GPLATPHDEATDEVPIKKKARAPIEAAIEVSGEVRVREHQDRAPSQEQLSSIFVELGEEDSAPVLIHDQRIDESAPVLLDRRRSSDAPTSVAITAAPLAEITDMPSEPLELPLKKPPFADPRKKNITQVGVGAVRAATRAKLVESA